MAYVAFDLDNTLGFFELTNPLAYFWSPEILTNPEQSQANGPVALPPRLLKRLARARAAFVNLLVQDPELLWLVLRPNLDSLMKPLLTAHRRGLLQTTVIYSNSSNTYSLQLGKALIEKHYRVGGFFSILADHWSPLRNADRSRAWRPYEYEEPLKTIDTLQVLFHEGSRTRYAVQPDQILFVDDRNPKHALQAQEKEGLTYLVPKAYVPKVTLPLKQRILALAMEALDSQALLSDPEYLHSPFCVRLIPYNYTKVHRIAGFPDLFQFVFHEIKTVPGARSPWTPDTAPLETIVKEYLKKVELNR